jgi:hypothetical protein
MMNEFGERRMDANGKGEPVTLSDGSACPECSADRACCDCERGVSRVFRCQHGEPIATRDAYGTWTGHDRCLRCRFAKWLSVGRWRLRG